MHDSHPIDAERRMQLGFSKADALNILAVPALLLGFAWLLERTPDLPDLGPRHGVIAFEPILLNSEGFGPLRLVGAWELSSNDPRFGGISALAVDGRDLLALSDAGALIRFGKPQEGAGRAYFADLPAGPAAPGFKRNRDSEALIRDPGGRGWWVAFENRHQLWLFSHRFDRALVKLSLRPRDWDGNSGIEALALDGTAILMIPEPGGTVLRLEDDSYRTYRLEQGARISDAVGLEDGTTILLERSLTPFGFTNALTRLEREGQAYRRGGRIPLSLGPLDNGEALAAERLPGGGVRLWLMTDDNHQPPLRTVLVALDLPRGALRAPAGSR